MKKLARNRLRVKAFQKLMAFAGWLNNIPARTTPPPFRLLQIGSAFWQSRALYVAAKLGLADEIGDGRKAVSEIAAALELHEGHLYRLMRMLNAIGIFREVSPGVFENSAASHYLRADNEKSMRAMILMHNSPQMTKAWTESLEACVRTGCIPFERSNGQDLFTYMDHDQDFDLLFARAMDAVEGLAGSAFLQDFDWGTFERIIDVGGSKGSKSISILRAHPALRAVVFDRPQVIAAARDDWRGKVPDELLARIEFEPGDMFEAIPAARSERDLYLLIAIFHGLSDEECATVLQRLRSAAGDKRPYVLFGDAVADEINIDPTIASMDMQMLVNTRGRERTRSEWTHLLEQNGFALIDVIDARTFAKFILARPR